MQKYAATVSPGMAGALMCTLGVLSVLCAVAGRCLVINGAPNFGGVFR
jgi:hypothetical protein